MQKQQLTFGMELEAGFGCGRPMSVSAYARRRGVSHFAVQRAIKDGRLTSASVLIDHRGHPKILDPAEADAEWERNTQATPGHEPADDGGGRSSLTLETIRERKWKAKLAELEYRQRAGELVPVRDVGQEWSVWIVEIKNTYLGLPNRLKQLLPELTRQQIAVIRDAVRQDLESLAGGRHGAGHGDGAADPDDDTAAFAAGEASLAVAVGG